MKNRYRRKKEEGKEETPNENIDVDRLVFTQKVISYNNKTLQLSNVTKIEKYYRDEEMEPIYKVTDNTLIYSFVALALSSITWMMLEEYPTLLYTSYTLFAVCCIVASYYAYERLFFPPYTKYYHGLIIETASGSTENLLTNDEEFMDRLHSRITKAMNSEQYPPFEAYFDKLEINNIKGDVFKDISSSTINNRSNLWQSVKLFFSFKN